MENKYDSVTTKLSICSIFFCNVMFNSDSNNDNN
jgi:hypothetical protein